MMYLNWNVWVRLKEIIQKIRYRKLYGDPGQIPIARSPNLSDGLTMVTNSIFA